MNISECHFCSKANDDSKFDSRNYERCKLINGNPCVACSVGIELDALIAETKTRLENLLFRKRSLRTEVVNPIHDCITHRLPPELSAHIFRFSLSGEKPYSIYDHENPEPSESHRITTPLTLGAVCRAWRSIVWASPNLWANISVPVKDWCDPEYLIIADDWLSRSGHLPLSMLLYTPRNKPTVIDCTNEERNLRNLRKHIKKIIRLHVPRCYSLEFSCRYKILPTLAADAPMLEEIKITSSTQKRDIRPIELYSTKPEGIRVSLTGYTPKFLTLPAANVTELEGLFTLEEYLTGLEKFPNLRESRVMGLLDTPPPGQRTRHDCLQKLALYSENESSCLVLEAVDLPSLTDLSIGNLDADAIAAFRSSIPQYSSNLKCLRVEHLRCDGEELCDILRSIKCLEELHLVEDHVKDFDPHALFQELAQDPVIAKPADSDNPDYLLPNLSVLTFTFRQEVDFPWDLVVGIFGSLDDIRNPLRRPIIDFQITYDWRIGNSQYYEDGWGDDWESDDPFPQFPTLFINKEVTQRFLDIAREGVKIKLYDAYAKDDMLRLSLEHHEIDVPEWYRPNIQSAGLSDYDLEIISDSDCSSDDEVDSNDSDSTDDSEEPESDPDEGSETNSELGSISDMSDTPYVPSVGLSSQLTGTVCSDDEVDSTDSDSRGDSEEPHFDSDDGSDTDSQLGSISDISDTPYVPSVGLPSEFTGTTMDLF